jgi:Ca-activated chloride channel family protein
LNQRATKIAERNGRELWIPLCILCLCGFQSLAAGANWSQQYNSGVAAYRSNDFVSAAIAFEKATASPDHAVQQRAFYNLGNADYRIGQTQPPQTHELWQRAVKHYESALALDPNDADAKFNLELVKKKIEELKKEQGRQQQEQDNQNQQQESQKRNDDQQQQAQQNQNHEQQQQQQKQTDSREEAKTQNEQQPQKQQEQQAANLDKQQAKALLDNMREDERNWNFFPELQMNDLKDAGQPSKDW